MPIQVKGNLAAFFAMLTWATGFPLVSDLLQTWDPMLMAVFRTLIPGLVLTLWAAITGGLVNFHPSQIRSVYVIGGLGLGFATGKNATKQKDKVVESKFVSKVFL